MYIIELKSFLESVHCSGARGKERERERERVRSGGFVVESAAERLSADSRVWASPFSLLPSLSLPRYVSAKWQSSAFSMDRRKRGTTGFPLPPAAADRKCSFHPTPSLLSLSLSRLCGLAARSRYVRAQSELPNCPQPELKPRKRALARSKSINTHRGRASG